MPASSFPEYAQVLRDTLDALMASGRAVRADMDIDGRSALRGYLAGRVIFTDHSELHFREFIDLTLTEPRVMYAYHYQDATSALIFRYDNARHWPSHAPALHEVLAEIVAGLD